MRVRKLFGSVRVCRLFGWSWASLLALGFLASRALPVCIFGFGLCGWSWFPGLLLLLLLLGSVAVAVAVDFLSFSFSDTFRMGGDHEGYKAF